MIKIDAFALSRVVEGLGPMKPGNRPLWQWCQFPQNGSILRDEGLREVSSLEGIFFVQPWHACYG